MVKDPKKQRYNRSLKHYNQDDKSFGFGRNYEGYSDPTAYQAIRNLERAEAAKSKSR